MRIYRQFLPGALFLAAIFLAAATGMAADDGDVAVDEESAPAEEAASADANAEEVEPLPEDYSCSFCHSDPEQFTGDEKHLFVTEEHLEGDIHWKKGLRCHDCHGGNPNLMEYTDHRKDDSFRSVGEPADIPPLCGSCHSDIGFMRRYDPSARTDQESEYWTSGHGRRLKATVDDESMEQDTEVATCLDCHGGTHGTLAVDDQRSPVYPTNVAETCATCHADEEKMAGRTYYDRAEEKEVPLHHDQYEKWQDSVHGKAMLEKGDLSAPTCNDCHGNHGATPPDVDSVANACGGCHGRIAELFAETRMKHKFEEEGLPGCATCHGNHRISSPTDELLGMGDDAICKACHEAENIRPDAMLAGAKVAKAMSDGLEQLKRAIADAEARVEEAELLGMEVRGPRFELLQARDALINARTLIHGFSAGPVEEVLAEGRKVAAEVQQLADEALKEHTYRRVWLATLLLPILIAVILLVLFIRSMPIPPQ